MLLVPQGRRHALVDLDLDVGVGGPPRPCDAERIAQPGDDRVRVVEQLLVAQEGAGQRAGRAFDIQDVAQPEQMAEMSDRRVASVARLERHGDVEGVADRRDDDGVRAEVGDRREPEIQ